VVTEFYPLSKDDDNDDDILFFLTKIDYIKL
jgi:hypothetical protein